MVASIRPRPLSQIHLPTNIQEKLPLSDLKPILRAACAIISTACLAGNATAQLCPGSPGASVGPDVIVGDLPNMFNDTAVGGIDAFAVATTSCNIGSVWLNWFSGTNQHPVIPQNMYRLKGGRFEQIGQGWMKHGFFALSQSLCCTCSGQTNGEHLGVGCSDPYTASRNGQQVTTTGGLGPRFQVNPHLGAFIFPYMARGQNITANGEPGSTISRRLQVAITDLDPALNPSSAFWIEAQYVTPDDALAGNQNNNVSCRQLTITGAAGATNFSASTTGSTVRMQPAITRWKVADPTVVETIIDTHEALSGDTTGRAIMSAKATDLGGGVWHYEYAIYNMNSDRAFDGVSIPASASLNVTNIGFHDVNYHSGDGFGSTVALPKNFDGVDWPGAEVSDTVQWNLIPASPVENSNALRWGTLYNVRFDCNSPPTTGNATLSYFKNPAGLPLSIDVSTIVPTTPVLDCPADINGDDTVNVADLLTVISAWGPCADCAKCPADVTPAKPDCNVNVADLLLVISAWGACP